MQEDKNCIAGLSEEEIQDKLAADKWELQQDYLNTAVPGQDVSPHVFNGFNENGAKDRIDEINNSPSLQELIQSDGIDDAAGDGAHRQDIEEFFGGGDAVHHGQHDGIRTHDGPDLLGHGLQSVVLHTHQHQILHGQFRGIGNDGCGLYGEIAVGVGTESQAFGAQMLGACATGDEADAVAVMADQHAGQQAAHAADANDGDLFIHRKAPFGGGP